MDRRTRRAQKARIHAQLRQILENKVNEEQERNRSCFGSSATLINVEQLRRHIYRNEGKWSVHWQGFYSLLRRRRCDCGYCTDSRRYRTRREAERMGIELREWRHGEGGY